MRNGPIGQYLVDKGLITEEQLKQVLEKQKQEKGKLHQQQNHADSCQNISFCSHLPLL